jgi:nicotinamide phosphoribosyltransferase
MAVKATAGIVNGEVREIWKDPKTDNGTKKSAKGYLAVYKNEDGHYYLEQQEVMSNVKNCEFEKVFCDGDLYRDETLADIRRRVR